jgi:hypothetical protein
MNFAQEAADALYQKSEEGEVSLADVVARFRNAWGEQGVARLRAPVPDSTGMNLFIRSLSQL